MSEAAAFTPPPDGSRQDLIHFYRMLIATPHTHPDFVELRRQGRDGLTLIGAAPAVASFDRGKRSLVSTHFRAARPTCRRRRP